jgi:PII-like signaling protein
VKQGQQTLLRLFVTEDDRAAGRPLYEVILEKARAMGVAGCTCLRGASGYGPSGRLHSDFPPDYAVDLPIVIEIVDESAKTDALLLAVEPLLGATLVTEEKLHVQHWRPRR